jgi:hypothetical protein
VAALGVYIVMINDTSNVAVPWSNHRTLAIRLVLHFRVKTQLQLLSEHAKIQYRYIFESSNFLRFSLQDSVVCRKDFDVVSNELCTLQHNDGSEKLKGYNATFVRKHHVKDHMSELELEYIVEQFCIRLIFFEPC